MKAEVVIRKADVTEAGVLTEISFSAKRYWNYPEEYYDTWKDELTITEDYIKYNTVYVALLGANIIGFYSIVYNPYDQTFGNVFMKAGYWMDHIFIRPEYIKRGFGSKLIDHLKRYCKDNGIKNLTVFVDPNAKGFYGKAGADFKYMSDSSIKIRLIPVYEFDFH